jgi:uncharacterized SAM-binding protein YcdF (DUF218 family)
MKIFIIIAVFLLLLAVIAFFARETVFQAIGDFLVIQDDLQPADLIHVIAGADHRTDYALELYQQGLGKQLFFTGGWCNSHKYKHGEHARLLAIEQGVPPDAVAINDDEVTSTYSEAEKLEEFIKENQSPIESVIVVSDPHHMRRARWTYQRVLGNEIQVQMAPVPYDSSPYQRQWWTDWDSWKMVKNEYQKILYYYARYKFSVGPLQEWLATFDTG